MTSPEHTSDFGNTMDRRAFLVRLELLAGGVMCGALPLLASGCAPRARYYAAVVSGNRLGVPVTQLAEGGVLVEDPRSELPIYLRRDANDTFTAVSTRCGHRGCQVEPTAEKMVCPCHGSEYTFEGAILQGPTERPLVRYRVSSENDMIYIHLAETL